MLLQIGSVHAAEQEERLLLMSDDLAWLMDVRINYRKLSDAFPE